MAVRPTISKLDRGQRAERSGHNKIKL